jgi:hypothetical protein
VKPLGLTARGVRHGLENGEPFKRSWSIAVARSAVGLVCGKCWHHVWKLLRIPAGPKGILPIPTAGMSRNGHDCVPVARSSMSLQPSRSIASQQLCRFCSCLPSRQKSKWQGLRRAPLLPSIWTVLLCGFKSHRLLLYTHTCVLCPCIEVI